jgi:predicted porin
VHVGLNTGKNGLSGAGALDRFNWHVGANLVFDGRHNVRVLAGRAKDRTATDAEATTFQLGYGYDLSKRTALYAAVGQMDNNDASTAALGGSIGTYAPGSTARSLVTGIRHIF